MIKVVLLRHGQSAWNEKGLFTGWVNVNLTPLGEKEARSAGQKLKKAAIKFDLAFESYLKRSQKTTKLALQELDIKLKIEKDWRLNERHYGLLQGMNKKELVQKYGEEQVFIWRRSYDIRPPKIKAGSKYDQSNLAKYKNIPVPLAESLKDVEKRVTIFWKQKVAPALMSNKKVLISASGNSLRALVKYLDKIAPDKIADLNIPTALPLVYELDNNLKPIRHYYLASAKELKAAEQKIKNQTKVKK
jgi:2,3-bisphosphoglycerate-dependent phosphoglycerate mutase